MISVNCLLIHFCSHNKTHLRFVSKFDVCSIVAYEGGDEVAETEVMEIKTCSLTKIEVELKPNRILFAGGEVIVKATLKNRAGDEIATHYQVLYVEGGPGKVVTSLYGYCRS